MLTLSNLIRYIKEFFYSLFYLSEEEISSQNALRNIFQELKQCKYPVYRNDNTVLAGLPMIIYEIYRISLPFKNILQETICSNDIRLSGVFLDKLVESSFSDNQKILKENLSFSSRMEKISDLMREDFDQKLKDQTNEFDELIFSLTDPAFKSVDAKINKLFAFFDFCSFQFNTFFAYFDPGFNTIVNTDSVRDHYNFENVDGMAVLQEILDLDYLIRNISVDEQLVDGILFLNSVLPQDKQVDEVYIKRNLKNFFSKLENSLGKDTLKNIAKLIKKDPKFEDKTKAPRVFSEIEEYKARFTANFSADTKKILKLRQDVQMSSLISGLFGDIEILKLDVYNEDLNSKIQALTGLSLDWIKPLEIVKTYTKNFFQPSIEPFLRELLVEGLFEDKKMKSDFAANYYYCSAVADKIDELEKVMYGKNESSIELIRGYLTRIEAGGDFERPLSKIIDEINLRAKKFLEDSGRHYLDLLKFCKLIIKDTYRPVPESVHNITSMINSTKNKDRFAVFANGMENFEKMIELLKKYVVIDISELNEKAGKNYENNSK
ncbi:hypothetical protein [Treponema denticola]|uniref:Uncharacterized protein n=1 Tax=Treponema denticola SP33 TaxID=999437 RepID=M2BV76_TREDN|nr:hypothetical protein [Treponema denticola]EMB25969.1 hypothetical protein HMPREF9733_00569 [Treponema denticola SP33]EPF37302.1 hypothetical protein HMPREF9732_01336 [Treponema denticola SP32]